MFYKEKVFAATDAPASSGSPPPGGTSYGSWPMPNGCTTVIDNYLGYKNNLRGKCGGVVLEDCIKEAKECISDGGQNSITGGGVSPLASMLQSSLMGGLTGGLPLVGSGGPQSFKCLTASRLDKTISNMEKLRDEAKKVEKDAKDYKRKIEDKKKDIIKNISDTKKDYAKKIQERKTADAKLPEEIDKLREESANKSEEYFNKIEEYDRAIGTSLSNIADKQTERGNLYVNTIGLCTKQLQDAKNNRLNEYFDEVKKLDEQLTAIYDLSSQYQLKKKFKALTLDKDNRNRELFQQTFQTCIDAQTKAYKDQYTQITNKIKEMEQGIAHLQRGIDTYQKKLSEIPDKLNKGIKALKDINAADKQTAVSEISAMQQELQDLVQDYQGQSSQANTEYQQAQMKLNIAQQQQFANQSIYQMTTFGDAASFLGGDEDYRGLLCHQCKSDGDEKTKRSKKIDFCDGIGKSTGGDGSL